MKALVTGSEGFVGTYLSKELAENGYEVIRCSLEGGDGFRKLDILDLKAVKEIIREERPDVIFHLAGQANVAYSWKNPQLTMNLNINGILNVLEAVRDHAPESIVIGAGSSDEYGVLGENGKNVTEDTPLNPVTPYAISKVAQEKAAFCYAKANHLDVRMVRCFNLCGVGQGKGFMIPDFASGIAEIEAEKSKELLVGNLDSARDFTDVRDAARAYRLIAEKGKAGEVYNICSGKAYTAREILNMLIDMAKCEIIVKQDPSRMRPSDTPVVYGSNTKMKIETKWNAEHGLKDTIQECLRFWRAV